MQAHPKTDSELQKRGVNAKPNQTIGFIWKRDTEKYNYHEGMCFSECVRLQRLQWAGHVVRTEEARMLEKLPYRRIPIYTKGEAQDACQEGDRKERLTRYYLEQEI